MTNFSFTGNIEFLFEHNIFFYLQDYKVYVEIDNRLFLGMEDDLN